MPEGDTIWRTAATLRKAILEQTVNGLRTSIQRVRDVAESTGVVGSTVADIETHGKHLVINFSCGATLRTHLQMTGSWHVYRPGSPWQKPERQARIVIETSRAIAICFNAPIVELERTASRASNLAIAHLGPDLLDDNFDQAEALRRLRARGHDEIAVALLDQSALAGIGNVYKSEVLFMCQVSPFQLVHQIPVETLTRLVETAGTQMRRNLRTTMRRTTGEYGRDRLWVYGHLRQPCRRCGEPIQRRHQGAQGRITYWCPRCQPMR